MTAPLYLPYDKTAVASSNLVTFEFHNGAVGQPGIVKCDYGPFYKNSPIQPFQIFAQISGQLYPLSEGSDYVLAEFDPKLTTTTGYDVFKAVLITNLTLPGVYAVCYQAVGGSNNPNVGLVYAQAQNPLASTAPVNFSDIKEKPLVYPPASHQHDVRDLYGADYLNKVLNDLKLSMSSQFIAFGTAASNPKNAEMISALNVFKSALIADAQVLNTDIAAHIGNTGFPHAYTAAMIGLGNVVNGGFTAQSANGVPLPIYASPYTVGYAIANLPTYTPTTHASLTNNPHLDTAANLYNSSLGNVRNLSMITAYNSGDYVAIFAQNASEQYLSAYSATNGVAQAQVNQIQVNYTNAVLGITAPTTGSLALTQTANTAASTALTAAALAQSATTAELVQANSAISQAQVANNNFTVVDYNAPYSALLSQLLLTDYAAGATNSSVSADGYYQTPALLDNLYLWLDVGSPLNTFQTDANGAIRLMSMTDRSSNSRLFVSNNLTTAPIYTQSQDVAQGNPGLTIGKVALFGNGTHMDQISGPPITIAPGMTILVLVRTSASTTPFSLLSETSQPPLAKIVVQPSPSVALSVSLAGSWTPLTSAANTVDPNASTLIVASISPLSEAYCWQATIKALPTNAPRGTATPASTWPTSYAQSAPMTRIGNTDPNSLDAGELVELIVFNRQLSFAEVQPVIDYLRLAKSHNLAFAVDTSAKNVF